jgi:hypothetical protein
MEQEKQRNREEYRKKMKKRAKKAWTVLGIIFFLLIFWGSIWGVIGVNIHYSDGERTVKIIKLSEKGFIWKTWEGEGVLAQEGFAVTYIWSFSVDNWDPNKQQLINDIKTAFETGQTVKIKYDQRAGSVPWRSETAYFVKEVRFPK